MLQRMWTISAINTQCNSTKRCKGAERQKRTFFSSSFASQRLCISLLNCISSLWIICCASPLSALPTVVPDPIPCVFDLETRFFDERIVNQGLSLYNIRQELWVPINQLLQRKSMEIPERMKRRTAFMVPNPIEYPMQRGMTAKILKEVLFEVFLETLRNYNANERPTADFAFDYIFNEQLPQFIRCFGEEARQLKPVFD